MRTETKQELRDQISEYKMLYKLEKNDHRNTLILTYAMGVVFLGCLILEVI